VAVLGPRAIAPAVDRHVHPCPVWHCVAPHPQARDRHTRLTKNGDRPASVLDAHVVIGLASHEIRRDVGQRHTVDLQTPGLECALDRQHPIQIRIALLAHAGEGVARAEVHRLCAQLRHQPQIALVEPVVPDRNTYHTNTTLYACLGSANNSAYASAKASSGKRCVIIGAIVTAPDAMRA